MPPKAAISSKPCGAAAMCCASRTRSKSGFPPDHESSREPRPAPASPTGPRRKWRGFVCGAVPRQILAPFRRALLGGLLLGDLLGGLLGGLPGGLLAGRLLSGRFLDRLP